MHPDEERKSEMSEESNPPTDFIDDILKQGEFFSPESQRSPKGYEDEKMSEAREELKAPEFRLGEKKEEKQPSFLEALDNVDSLFGPSIFGPPDEDFGQQSQSFLEPPGLAKPFRPASQTKENEWASQHF